ncbi:hypothetical protein WwAna0635 [Wolbachia endosymbiont of Drosophila ananassae]|nr:hypothetical protein WwAna0635 [Wolbachia endosymbiont of Drosophila ananassae]
MLILWTIFSEYAKLILNYYKMLIITTERAKAINTYIKGKID